MKKNVYVLDDIDCLACSYKIEEKLNSMDGVSASMNFIFLKLIVNFDENIVTDSEIESAIYNSLRGVSIVEKNNEPFESPKDVIKKKLFFGRRK